MSCASSPPGLQGDEGASRQRASVRVDNLRHLARYTAQIAALNVGVNIHDGADVVLVYDLHLMSASDIGKIVQDFWIRRC